MYCKLPGFNLSPKNIRNKQRPLQGLICYFLKQKRFQVNNEFTGLPFHRYLLVQPHCGSHLNSWCPSWLLLKPNAAFIFVNKKNKGSFCTQCNFDLTNTRPCRVQVTQKVRNQNTVRVTGLPNRTPHRTKDWENRGLQGLDYVSENMNQLSQKLLHPAILRTFLRGLLFLFTPSFHCFLFPAVPLAPGGRPRVKPPSHIALIALCGFAIEARWRQPDPGLQPAGHKTFRSGQNMRSRVSLCGGDGGPGGVLVR